MWFLEILTMAGFALIALQDFKYREVLWILFPATAVLLAIRFILHIGIEDFMFFSALNALLVTLMLLLLWGYTKWIMRKKLLNQALGLGDMLFLYGFALGFPTLTFIILLVGSLCFALAVYSITIIFKEVETVPLAGLMGIFLILMLSCSHLPTFPSLYLI